VAGEARPRFLALLRSRALRGTPFWFCLLAALWRRFWRGFAVVVFSIWFCLLAALRVAFGVVLWLWFLVFSLLELFCSILLCIHIVYHIMSPYL